MQSVKNTLIVLIFFLFACSPSKQNTDIDFPEVNWSDSFCINKPQTALIDSFADPFNKSQIDSMITAARENDIDLINSLLDDGLNPNVKLIRGAYYPDSPLWDSPLYQAVSMNNVEVVKILIERGADPNQQLGMNLTPFHRSAGNCFYGTGCLIEIFKLLLAKGGAVNTLQHNKTPLMSAIESGDLEKTRILIEHGAIIDPDSLNGFQSPLAIAARHLQYEMVDELIKRGANINAQYSDMYEDCMLCPDNITIVHQLVGMLGYEDKEKVERILDLVLRSRPDLNIENGSGFTPLEFVMFGSNFQLADRLIALGAKLETKGSSSLHCAAYYSNFSTVDYLLKKKVNVNLQDESGNTALMICLECCGDGFGEGITLKNRLKTIELLLDHGADPMIKNNRDESFIENCKDTPYKEIANAMVVRGLLKKKDLKTESN